MNLRRGKNQSVANFYQRGGPWVLAQSGLLLAIFLLAIRSRGVQRNPLLVSIGIGSLVLGGALVLAGAVALGRNLTPYPRPAEKAQLVSHGIFALMRHPIYSGTMLMSIGWALVWQSSPALLIALALARFFDAKARREECWLEEKFPGYLEYRRRVKRFLPWIY